MPKVLTTVGSSDDHSEKFAQEEPSAIGGQNDRSKNNKDEDGANDGDTLSSNSKDTAQSKGSQRNDDNAAATATATTITGDSAGQEAGESQDGDSAEKLEAKEKDRGDDADEDKLWMYLDGINPTQHGPFAQTIMLRLLRTGSAHKDMMAWSEGMAEWKAIGQVPTTNIAPTLNTDVHESKLMAVCGET